MSLLAMTSVWSDATMKDQGTTLLMLAIADNANDDGICWPSITTLAGKSRMSYRSVCRKLTELVKEGRLVVLSGQGNGGTNRYQIVADKVGQIVLPGKTPICPTGSDTAMSDRTINESPLNKESAFAPISVEKKARATQEVIDRAIEHKKFVSLWKSVFLQFKKIEYNVSKQEWKAVEILIATGQGPQGLIDMAIDAWKNPHFGWCCSNLKSLWHFAKKFNEINVELTERKDANQRSTKPRTDGNLGTANEGQANLYRDVGKVV